MTSSTRRNPDPAYPAESLHPLMAALCRCCRPEFDRSDGERVEALLADCEPDAVLEAVVEHHRVPSLVAERLATLEPGAVSERIRDALRDASRTTAVENLRRTRLLVDVLAELEAGGVPAIPFKGPVVAETVYGDLGRRQFVDLDVMVPRDRIDDAGAALARAGFDPVEGYDEFERSIHRRRASHFRFRRDGIPVELHWRLSPASLSASIDHGWLTRRTVDVDLADRSVPALDPEARLVILCIHGSKHRWARLKWLCDVAHLVDGADLDWEQVRREAGRLGRSRQLALGLLLAAELLDAPVPRAVLLEARRSSPVRPLVDEVVVRSLTPDGEVRHPMRTVRFRYRTLERRRDRLAFLGWFLFGRQPADAGRRRVPLDFTETVDVLRPIRLGARLVQLTVADRRE